MKCITPYTAKKVYQHSKKAFGIFTLTLLLFTSFLIINQNAEAQQLVCPMRAIDQITDETAGFSLEPSINADGTRIAFFSSADINGGNPDENAEIYLAVCFDPSVARPIPTLGEWGLIAMAGVLGIVGFMVMRRRKASA